MTEKEEHKLNQMLGAIAICAIILGVNFKVSGDTWHKNQIVNTLDAINENNPKAKYYINRDFDNTLEVSAEAYLVGDLHTGEVIISKNGNVAYPIASVSKLMTALVAENLPTEEKTAVVSKNALSTYGQNGNLRAGEKIALGDLLYPLLLESSNDASEVIAEHFGKENFIKKMNQLAEKLFMTKTAYEDPSGLSANNKSSVNDLFKLTGYLLSEKTNLLEITKTRSYSTKRHNWSNNGRFLREKGYMGGKSGYTDPAKETIVSIFSLPLGEDAVRPIAIILLRSKDRYQDVKTVLKYIEKNIYYRGTGTHTNDWVRSRADLPDISEPDFVTLSFGGDVMLDRGVRASVLKNFQNDYGALFENLEIFKNDDISFFNLEGPASDTGTDRKNLYSFRMDPTVLPALSGAGVEIVSVANNHVGDWGRDAYRDTLVRLKENRILYAGGGTSRPEAEEPTVIEKYGIKVGFLGFSDVGPDWMRATEDQAGLLLANNPRFEEIIKNASEKVDYLVVSFHFGEEYKTTHNSRQENLARKAVDAGAKIVIGHHPHVVQDEEVYNGAYIAYSLGNLIFDQAFSKNTMESLLLKIKLGRDGTMTVQRNKVTLNRAFQPEKIIAEKEEKIPTTLQ